MILYRIEYRTRDNRTASQNGCLGIKPEDATIQDVLKNQTLFVERNWIKCSFYKPEFNPSGALVCWVEFKRESK